MLKVGTCTGLAPGARTSSAADTSPYGSSTSASAEVCCLGLHTPSLRSDGPTSCCYGCLCWCEPLPLFPEKSVV